MSSISKPSVVIPKISGTTIFTNSTNNINLLNIGKRGLEIGDVITVIGAYSNNKNFTVEVITDDDNVIVNQAHAGGTTTKSLVDETVGATITLLSRAKNAPIGLGQGWCIPTRVRNTTYTNPTNRAIKAFMTGFATNSQFITLDSLALKVGASGSNAPFNSGFIYKETVVTNVFAITEWAEMR